jgi:hypothetical protein
MDNEISLYFFKDLSHCFHKDGYLFSFMSDFDVKIDSHNCHKMNLNVLIPQKVLRIKYSSCSFN